MLREEFDRQRELSDGPSEERVESILKNLELATLQRIASRFEGVERLVDILDDGDEQSEPTSAVIIPLAEIRARRDAETVAPANVGAVEAIELTEQDEWAAPSGDEVPLHQPVAFKAPSLRVARPVKAKTVKRRTPVPVVHGSGACVNRPMQSRVARKGKRVSEATHHAVWLWTR